MCPERGHHGAVVGAQAEFRHADGDAGLAAAFFEQRTQTGVGRDAAADHEVVALVVAAGHDGLLRDDVDDGFLEGRGDVGDGHRFTGGFAGGDPARHGRLEAGEAEVVTVLLEVLLRREPAWERDGLRVSALGCLVDVRAARVGQAEHAGDLVERFAARVVDRVAEAAHVGGDVRHVEQVRVPAGDEQTHGRLGQRAVVEDVHGHMRGEVVDAVQRLVEGHGEGLGGGDTDHERAGEAGPYGDGDGVDVGELHSGRVARATQGGQHRLKVGAARDLGHDAAEADVQIHAARHLVGEQGGAAHDADARLVARALDAENQRLPSRGDAHEVSRSLRMMTASTSPGW